jgi:hypothetical protein
VDAREAVERLIVVATSPTASADDHDQAATDVFQALKSRGTEVAEAEAILARLTAAIRTAPPAGAAMLAGVAGQLVGAGLPGDSLIAAVMQRIAAAAPLLADLRERVVGPDDDEPETTVFEAVAEGGRASIAERTAYLLINALYPAATGGLCLLPSARERFRTLEPLLAVSEDVHEGAHWIAKLLRVLHEEPYVAIEPGSGIGIQGKMSGISENFQLNVLLMDVFPSGGFLARRRVSREAARIARGQGPQVADENIRGAWNLYGWRALTPDGRLPPTDDTQGTEHWIWNEGTPRDIPMFDDRRVILIGPATYQRTWRSQRDYPGLDADLTVERRLDKDEVTSLLRAMAEAARSPRAESESPG